VTFLEKEGEEMTEQTTIIPCPICNADIDRHQCELMGRLSSWGYLHVDFWLKCPKCGFTPCFGKEMEDAKPVYWHPTSIPEWLRKAIKEAFKKHIEPVTCLFCPSKMELHKVYVNSYRELCDGPTGFLVPTSGVGEQKEVPVARRFLPSGILAQYKCVSWRCKYVRYVTL